MEQNSERETLTINECAARLGICRGSAYKYARTGALPTLRIGKKLVVPRRALDRLLESAEIHSEAAREMLAER